MSVPHPLDKIRVLEISRFIAGPLAGRLLADLGADAVKVEGLLICWFSSRLLRMSWCTTFVPGWWNGGEWAGTGCTTRILDW